MVFVYKPIKQISVQYSTSENYETAVKVMKNFYEFKKKKDVYVLSNVKDYSETSLPVEVAMNKNNIRRV